MSLDRCCPCVFRKVLWHLRVEPPRKVYVSESKDEKHYLGTESNAGLVGGFRMTWTKNDKLFKEHYGLQPPDKGRVRPTAVVELLDRKLKEFPPRGVSSILARGDPRAGAFVNSSFTQSKDIYSSGHEPQGQGGHLQGSSSSSVGQVGVTLQGGGNVTEARASGRVHPPGEGGSREAPPACVSSGIRAVGAASAEEWDSESERDQGRPSKHRARHARFKRSESQLERQTNAARSKCKRIALLLTAAPNPNNKGVLMFRRHRQKSREYTLVSYGTREEDLEAEDQEETEGHTFEVTFLANVEPPLKQDLLVDAQGCGSTVTLDRNCGPSLEVKKKLNTKGEMAHLPETMGKGALLFARRRQRVDEIAAAHEEMRQKGIPVEGPPGSDSRDATLSYQAGERSCNLVPASHSGKVTAAKQQQMEHQYHQPEPQPQVPLLTPALNGTSHPPPVDTQKSINANRTAQPFSGVANRVPVPFSPSVSIGSPDLDQPGYLESKYRVIPPPVAVSTRPQVLSPTDREQIVSRDERIAVPAIKTGMLQDTKRRNAVKTASASKGCPTASQSSELLSAIKGDKRAGFELNAEEDYLSLGAEACNFMQPPTIKHKTPPPVAPKPNINLACPPWASDNVPVPMPSEIPVPGTSPSQAHLPQQHAAVSTWTPPRLHPPHQQPSSAWAPAQPKAQPQASKGTWASPSQHQAQAQPPWAQKQTPASSVAPAQNQFRNSWSQPYISASSAASHLSQASGASTHALKAYLPGSSSSGRAVSPASDMPTVRGRGAELFAKRQSRMEKFIVDSETVQANKARAQSPTPSLPSAWKYSSNVRAPPPLAYNPLLAPSCPPAAVKQPPPPPTMQAKPKSNINVKPSVKHLNSLDVMKHQPYKLHASLFTYSPSIEEKPATPSSPTPACIVGPAPGSPAAKPTMSVSVPYPFVQHSPQQTQAPPKLDHPRAVLPSSPPLHDGPPSHAPVRSPQLLTFVPGFPKPSMPEPVPMSARQAAPRPKFSARKPTVTSKAWRPVVMGQP